MGLSSIFVPHLARYLHFFPNFFGGFTFSSYLCTTKGKIFLPLK